MATDSGSGKFTDEINPRELLVSLKDKISQFYGEIGSGQMVGNISVKFCVDGLIVLRCAREHEANIRFILTTVSIIKKTTLSLRSLGVSGSSRTCILLMNRLISSGLEADWAMTKKERTDKKSRMMKLLQNSL